MVERDHALCSGLSCDKGFDLGVVVSTDRVGIVKIVSLAKVGRGGNEFNAFDFESRFLFKLARIVNRHCARAELRSFARILGYWRVDVEGWLCGWRFE